MRTLLKLCAALLLLLPPGGVEAQSQHPIDQLFNLLRREYTVILTVVNQAQTAQTPEARGEGIARLDKELVPHLQGKAHVLYPVLQEAGAAQEVELALRLQREALDTLQRLQQLDPAAGEAADTLSQLNRQLQSHFKHEEESLFPVVFYHLRDVQIQRILIDYLDYRRKFPSAR